MEVDAAVNTKENGPPSITPTGIYIFRLLRRVEREVSNAFTTADSIHKDYAIW